jgi:hypothetical protein
MEISLPKGDLHLIGIASIFISSKYEDVIPIYLDEIVNEACHNKFTNQEIIKYE